jgi:hypothetical protein
MSPLLIPFYLVMLDLGLLNSYAALWIPAGVSSFGIFLCRQFIQGIPQELYDAAIPTRPGLGIDINEAEAAKHPFKLEAMQRYFHPDGSVADW